MSSASLIEVTGPASAAMSRAAELRRQGWTVSVRGSRLSSAGEVVWSLEVQREAASAGSAS